MSCPACDDTGWKTVEQDGVRRVVRCDCWRDAVGARLVADARIPLRYQHCDLDNFVLYDNERLVRAVKGVRRFIDTYPVVEKGLFLIGPPGIGKSHLAVAALKAVMLKTRATGLFYDVRELLRVIRHTYDRE